MATVETIHETGEIEVQLDSGATLLCDVLETSHLRSGGFYRVGDRVVVVLPLDEALGCIVGRRRTLTPEEVHEERTSIVAEHGVHVRSGAASLTLHSSGRVSIQGRDVVTSARRKNRIKGGSVQIN